MNKIASIVSKLARPVIESLGCELWDVEYLKEAGGWVLRVYIDKEGGVNIADCEAVSRRLDALLDEADPIPDSYVFEVSSAGAERELKRPSDFAKFIGSTVEVRLYKPFEGRKSHVGKLESYDKGAVVIRGAGDQIMQFESTDIAQVRLRIV